MKKSSKQIRKELVSKNQGEYTGNELVFDPETGDLMVKARKEPKPSADATVLDQIAEDGFL